MKQISKNSNISNSNCIEHILCNILQHNGFDYHLLFANSWNFVYEQSEGLPLRDRFNIYNGEYLQLYQNLQKYYGVKVKKYNWNQDIKDALQLHSFLDENDYIALCLRTRFCPWLISTESVEEYHYVLLQHFETLNIYCYDYHSEQIHVLPYEQCQQGMEHFLVFDLSKLRLQKENLRDDIKEQMRSELETRKSYEGILSFSKAFLDDKIIRKELAIGQILTSPFLRRISIVGFGRLNFASFLRANFAGTFPCKNDIEQLEQIGKDWLFINKLLTKYHFTKKSNILDSIILRLERIAEKEKELIGDLYSYFKE